MESTIEEAQETLDSVERPEDTPTTPAQQREAPNQDLPHRHVEADSDPHPRQQREDSQESSVVPVLERQQAEIDQIRADVTRMGQQFATASGKIEQVIGGLQQTMLEKFGQIPEIGQGGQNNAAGEGQDGKKGAGSTLFEQIRPALELLVPLVAGSRETEAMRGQSQSPYDGLKESLGIVGELFKSFITLQGVMYKGVGDMVKQGVFVPGEVVASPPALPSRSSRRRSPEPEPPPVDEEEERPVQQYSGRTRHVVGV